ARAEPLARNELQSLECILRGGLIILIIRYEPAARFRCEDFRRLEVRACEGRFAGAGGTDQDNECEFWDLDFHHQYLQETATCGGRSTRSTSLIGVRTSSG